MKTVYLVITNSGDGSNGLHIVRDPLVLEKMEELANDGDESYASGDGLQSTKLTFQDDFNLDVWVKAHFYGYTDMEDME